jgi:tetratricopeptide (TPR) repeat protein
MEHNIRMRGSQWIIVVALTGVSMMGLRNVYGVVLQRQAYQTFKDGNRSAALKLYARAATLLPHNGNQWYLYTQPYYEMKYYDHSIALMQKALKYRHAPHFYAMLGHCFLQTGQWQKAIEAFTIASNMIPSKLYPRTMIAQALYRAGRYKEALKHVNTLLHSREKFVTAQGKEMKLSMITLKREILQQIRENEK